MERIKNPSFVFVRCRRCGTKLSCTKHESMAYCPNCGTWNSVVLDGKGRWSPSQATGRLIGQQPL